jgi:predicted Fe-Mo cluster-binding NifX family protein
VVLTIDEFEAVRLADLVGLYQEEAAKKMNVSRQTFGNIIESAHKKIADAIINAKALKIKGGIVKMTQEQMRLCIPTATNEGKTAAVHGHFGSAPFFTIFDTADGSVEIIDNANEHHSHGACQPMSALTGKKIDAVVCAGMGARAVQKLNEGGIKVYRAISGTAADIAGQFLKGGLEEITVENACMQHKCH